MHGAGNDYVYVDGFNHKIPTNPQSLAVAISDRHTGVGADGLILILPSKNADAQMRMYNADGTESEMCGNGTLRGGTANSHVELCRRAMFCSRTSS